VHTLFDTKSFFVNIYDEDNSSDIFEMVTRTNKLLAKRHYYNSWFFLLDFPIKKKPKSDKHKKPHLVNLDKSFWPSPT
jgi:hypothetical protein